MEHKSQAIGAEHHLTRSLSQYQISIPTYVCCFDFPRQSAQVTYNNH